MSTMLCTRISFILENSEFAQRVLSSVAATGVHVMEVTSSEKKAQKRERVLPEKYTLRENLHLLPHPERPFRVHRIFYISNARAYNKFDNASNQPYPVTGRRTQQRAPRVGPVYT